MSMLAFTTVLVLGGWAWGEAPGAALLATASGTAFAAIAVGQMANAFACRSSSVPAWRLPFRSNPLVLAAVGAEVLLLLASSGRRGWRTCSAARGPRGPAGRWRARPPRCCSSPTAGTSGSGGRGRRRRASPGPTRVGAGRSCGRAAGEAAGQPAGCGGAGGTSVAGRVDRGQREPTGSAGDVHALVGERLDVLRGRVGSRWARSESARPPPARPSISGTSRSVGFSRAVPVPVSVTVSSGRSRASAWVSPSRSPMKRSTCQVLVVLMLHCRTVRRGRVRVEGPRCAARRRCTWSAARSSRACAARPSG